MVYIPSSAFRNGKLTSLTIGSDVTTIGVGAFRNNNLTSVTIPDSVTTIGGHAFRNNYIVSVTIGNGVTYIGSNAFANNPFTSLTIYMADIPSSAFRNGNLTSLTIGSDVTTIGGHAFRNNNIVSVIIPDNVTNIGRYAFHYNGIAYVSIGHGVTSIGTRAFHSNRLSSVMIPSNVTAIGFEAFVNNPQLANVTIDGSVESREWRGTTFSGDRLTSVTFPDGIDSFHRGVFAGNLRNISRVSIGADVDLDGRSTICTWRGFRYFYEINGRRAGVYTFSDNRWHFAPRDSMPTLVEPQPLPEPPAYLILHPPSPPLVGYEDE